MITIDLYRVLKVSDLFKIIRKLPLEDQVPLVLFICSLSAKITDTRPFIDWVNDNAANFDYGTLNTELKTELENDYAAQK